MEKAQISPYQLFALILLFELGSALLVPFAMEAKQDAWLAILIGTVGGFGLFLYIINFIHITPIRYQQPIFRN